jgi:hypothetical protein
MIMGGRAAAEAQRPWHHGAPAPTAPIHHIGRRPRHRRTPRSGRPTAAGHHAQLSESGTRGGAVAAQVQRMATVVTGAMRPAVTDVGA